MADGSVRIDVGLNTSKAGKELAKLQGKIETLENTLNENSEKKSTLLTELSEVGARLDEATEKVRKLKEEYQNSGGLTKSQLKEELEEAVDEQRRLNAEFSRLNREYDQVNRRIDEGTSALNEMQNEAGGLVQEMEESRPAEFAENIKEQLDGARKKLITFVKQAIGIATLGVLFKKLGKSITSAVKAFAEQDEETKSNIQSLKSALSTLQLSWGAAFAPILNAVTPSLRTLIEWLTSAANAVARFIAILSGKSTYKRAVANNNALAKSVGGVGGAIEETRKQLAGFDELEILGDSSSSGGGGVGGAGSAADIIEELTGIGDGSFISNLALSFKDVLFSWNNINPEKVVEKLIAFVNYGLLGGALGFKLGGVPGAIIGTIVGVGLGIVFDSLIFNHDGVLSDAELKKSLNLVLFQMTGGAVGFLFGGIRGAVAGAGLGAVLYLAIEALNFKKGGKLNKVIEDLVDRLGVIAGAAIGWKVGGPGGAVIGATIGAAITFTVKELLFGDKDKPVADKLLEMLPNLLPIGGAIIGWETTKTASGALMGALVGAVVKIVIDSIDPKEGTFDKKKAVESIVNIVAGIGGAIAGFLLTGKPQGALIGFSISTALTLGLSLLEDKGGVVGDLAGIIKGTIIALAGAAIGLTVSGGNPVGALVGLVAGITLAIALERLSVDEKAKKAAIAVFKKSELGKEVDSIKADIKSSMEVSQDLKVKIASITGEVDEATLVNLGAAQQLLDDIFTLDAKESKTSEEAELIIQKINTLNGMSIPGLFLEYDTAKQHVKGTREQIQGLIDDLLRQYEMEAMHDAAVEAYKAQYQATQQVETATGNAERAVSAYNTAVANLTAAEQELNAAQSAWESFESANAGYWTSGQDGKDSSVYKRYMAAKQAADEAKAAVEETQTTMTEADTALETALENCQTATESIDGISEKLVELSKESKEEGVNFIEGNAQAIKDTAPKSVEAVIQAGQDQLKALRDTFDSHSPSKETETEGRNFMEGMKLGVEEGSPLVVTSLENAANRMLSVFDSFHSSLQSKMTQVFETVSEYVRSMAAMWQSDWGRPKIHFPVFSLQGVIDFQRGLMPQIVVSDWMWAARGGIVDGLTPLIAGEAGKEAIVPLERNTEWISLVANGLMERLQQINFANRMAEAFASVPMPAMAGGHIAPPNALSAAYGGGFGNSLIDEIKALRSEINALASQPVQVNSKLYMDRREVGKGVTEFQRQQSRTGGY